MQTHYSHLLSFLAGGAVVLALVLTGSTAQATPTLVQMTALQPAQLGAGLGEEAAAGTSAIHYQGRLLNPITGQPKPDGAYTMVFSLYAESTGGTALWTESKNVLANKGLFSTLLGDTTPFPAGVFNGDIRYLGVAVGGDAEAVPRQQIASVAYAIFAATAGDANTVDGKHAVDFAAATHNHDSRYPVLAADGSIQVDRVKYNTPRVQYFTLGSEAFVPGSNVSYVNTYGQGDAYITSGSGALVAPVHLPQGAKITELTVYFNDTSTSDMNVSLDRKPLTAGSFVTVASVSSSGTSGRYSRTTTNTGSTVIDNVNNSYLIYAWSDSWNTNLRLKGAVITYTMTEAP